MKENTMGRMNINNLLGLIITELGFVLWGILAWVYMASLFIAIAAVREFILIPTVGEELALPISGLLSVFSIFILAYNFMCCIQFPRNNVAFWVLGTLWVLFTLSFEYVVQVQFVGRDLTALSQMFLFKGVVGNNFYIPIILPVFAAPWMLSRLRRNAGKRERAAKRHAA